MGKSDSAAFTWESDPLICVTWFGLCPPLIPRTSSFAQIKALHSFDRVFLRFKIFVLVASYLPLSGQR